MNKLLIRIYDFFEQKRWLLYLILIPLMSGMALLAIQIKVSEDITDIFPDNDKNMSLVFKNIKSKDKTVIMFSSSPADGDEGSPDRQVECSERFFEILSELVDIEGCVMSEVDEDKTTSMTNFIYSNLPILVSDETFNELDSLTARLTTYEKMERNYQMLASPMGAFVGEYLYRDPLGISGQALASLQNMNTGSNYQIYNDHIFSANMETMLVFIEPDIISEVGVNRLIRSIDRTIAKIEDSGEWNDVRINYFGGPAMSFYNARQIKLDTMVTLNIAILIVVLVITISFRNKWSVLLIILPVLFGALFSLSIIYLIAGRISAIALGSGAVVLCIAMSYSIHMVSHNNRVSDPRKIICEMSWPMTVGSLTTIGAFLGLLFTQSKLLQDFGLFAALTLVGTTLFSLLFLPHMLSKEQSSQNRIFNIIEKINNYHFDRNRWLIVGVLILTTVCAFFYKSVGFDSDMMNMNYYPEHLREGEEVLSWATGNSLNDKNVLLVVANKDQTKAIETYQTLVDKCRGLKDVGDVVSFSSIADLLVSDSTQERKLTQWRDYWTDVKTEQVTEDIGMAAKELGFRDGVFSTFEDMLSKDYRKVDYSEIDPSNPIFSEWINVNDSLIMFMMNMTLPKDKIDEVYPLLKDESVIIVDRSYYAGKMASVVNDNFNLVLYFSSILIFVTLLLSFGRIELALLSFIPMFISWIIVLGLMALFGIEFNLVNIILSTFIFGIGDDYSIFIMDGLLGNYRDGRKILSEHKIAIFFSAFTLLVGFGSLIFAKHPAIKSIALISIFGMVSVVVVSFTLLPLIFRWIISSQTRKGGYPYTLLGFANTVYAFSLFFGGCVLTLVVIVLLHLIPMKKRTQKKTFLCVVSKFIDIYLRLMFCAKLVDLNEGKEDFKKPGVIIANHQSVIDILLILRMHPKLVMLTNSWVWNSPFFGHIVRYADFYHIKEGYEKLVDKLKSKVEEGYSVMVFPEGTRSKDNTIGRFHKGAFYLAEQLELEIIPVVLYGTGLLSSKRQPMYAKKGKLVTEILPRISNENALFGEGYPKRTKEVGHWFRERYRDLYERYNTPDNSYTADALIKNYIFKGPVLEWYMRVKLRMEKRYRIFNDYLPREGHIVDLGCGYGSLSYMLAILSDRRTILGVDYDEDKIALANHSYYKNNRIEFVCADISDYDLPLADGYVISDVLHYMPPETQDGLVGRCLEALKPGGVLIIRDGDGSDREKHKATKKTEKWSTQIMKFNKTINELHFTSTEEIVDSATKYGAKVDIIGKGKKTSNTIYLISKVQKENEQQV